MIIRIALYNQTDGLIQGFYQIQDSVLPRLLAENPGTGYLQDCPRNATHVIDGQPVKREKPAPTTEYLLVRIRRERNRRLSKTDFTMLEDSGKDKAKWKKYRQELRDFPATCDPHNPVWPTPPEGN